MASTSSSLRRLGQATLASAKGRQASTSRQMTKDWSAAQYLKFDKERTRPSHDLLAQVPLTSPGRVIDLGCGPGNSTAVVAAQYPDAGIEGIDTSPDMLDKARKALPRAKFAQGDLATFAPDEPVDLMFSNAVFHWLSFEDRIPTIKRLLQHLRPGGVFAMQVPDNHLEPSHTAMRAVAEDGPWAELLAQKKPALGPFQTVQELYDELVPLSSSLDIWHTIYQHPVNGHEGVVEWVKGTGLRPFLDPLGAEDRELFLSKYLAKLKELYPVSADGKVLLRYPRLFLVAQV